MVSRAGKDGTARCLYLSEAYWIDTEHPVFFGAILEVSGS